MRQFVLKNKEREKTNKQIESEINEKKKAKKNYSQKSKTIRDREKMIKYSNEQRIIARIKNVDRAVWHYVLIKLKNIENYKQIKRDEREKAKIDAKKNLKVKRFRDEMFDRLFFHDFLSRINETWLAIWFEQQLMKKQKKNEKMKRIKNAEDAEKIWKATKEKEKAKKTKSAICYSMFILLLYFVCKNLYSSCNRKRWIFFENQC